MKREFTKLEIAFYLTHCATIEFAESQRGQIARFIAKYYTWDFLFNLRTRLDSIFTEEGALQCVNTMVKRAQNNEQLY